MALHTRVLLVGDKSPSDDEKTAPFICADDLVIVMEAWTVRVDTRLHRVFDFTAATFTYMHSTLQLFAPRTVSLCTITAHPQRST